MAKRYEEDADGGWSLEPEPGPGTALQTITPTVSVDHQLDRVDGRLVMLTEPGSQQAAAYRVLRHRLTHARDPRVILITSPGHREGKTVCAANLALALAEGRANRVMLVEINGQAPSLAELFRIESPLCFFEQLDAYRRNPKLPWVVVEVHGTGLHVAAIAPENRGARLIDWPVFHHALRQFRNGFDHIVIDAPSVLDNAEVNLVQDSVDGVVVTAAAGRTRMRDIRRALKQLHPAPVLGVSVIEVA